VSTSPEAVAAGATTAAPATTTTCANCGASVPGKYCGNCGQRLHNPVHSVWHFIGEATEDLTHADSRLWRTLLALLLRPGFLTREFIDGRRASYLPPVRLYLVLSVLFFLLAGSTRSEIGPVGLSLQPSDHGTSKVVVIPIEKDRPGETLEQRQARVCGIIQIRGFWGSATLEQALRKACIRSVGDNGRSMKEEFFHQLPRAMFVFLPLLAAVMTLLYWRPRHYYVEQLLLLIHNHAFVFLVVIMGSLLKRALPAAVWTSWPVKGLVLAVQIYVAIYIYRSMRRVYAQGQLLTVAKFAVMSFAYWFSAFLMVALTLAYSILSL
jgi:hypothetical protein